MIKSIFYLDGDEFKHYAFKLAEYWETDFNFMPGVTGGIEKIISFSRIFSREIIDWMDCDEGWKHHSKIAFFGNGTKKTCPDFGFTTSNASILAAMINSLDPESDLYFYCCSLGAKNGFLEKLSIMCPFARIVGHTTNGHPVKNPYVFLSDRGKNYRFRLPVIFEQPEDWGTFESYAEYIPKEMLK